MKMLSEAEMLKSIETDKRFNIAGVVKSNEKVDWKSDRLKPGQYMTKTIHKDKFYIARSTIPDRSYYALFHGEDVWFDIDEGFHESLVKAKKWLLNVRQRHLEKNKK